jgi:hypothetical protein
MQNCYLKLHEVIQSTPNNLQDKQLYSWYVFDRVKNVWSYM